MSAVVSILFFTLATALAAKVRVPIPGTVVPMTLQSVFVLLAGLQLGSRKGAISQILYVVGGAIGLPFFAGESGLAVLLGPTGGYLIGFIPAAWLAGYLNGPTFRRSFAAAFIGSLAILIPGLLWGRTFSMVLLPFLVGNILKVTLAASVHRFMRLFFYSGSYKMR